MAILNDTNPFNKKAKLDELDELRRTVDAIPNEVIRAYTAQKYVHHGRMNQEI